MATGPNQTWSWDITKLLGPKKWTYFYLYVVLDIFSRYAVGCVNGGAKLVPPGGAKLVHLTLCGTRCWGVVPVVHRRDPRCFV